MQLTTGKIRFLLICFIALIIIGFCWGFTLFPSTVLAGRIKTLVEEELSRFLAAEVQVAEVGLFFFAPELREVKVRTAEGEPVFTAEKVRVGLDWLKLLTHRSLNDGLRNIDLMETTVWLWDTLSLFGNERGGGGANPRITVKLSDCQLIMEKQGGTWSWGNFHDLNGLVDLRSYPFIQVTAEGKSSLDPNAEAGVEVAYAVKQNQGKIRINAHKATAALWGEKIFRLLGYDRQFKVEAGALNAELSLLIQTGKVKLDTTRLLFADSRWEIAALPDPVRDLDADVTVSSTGITVRNFRGRYREGQISLNGNLATTSLGIKANLEATGLNPADWTSLIPQFKEWKPAGLVDVNLQIGGELKAPRVEGEVRMMDGRLTIPGFFAPLEDLRLLARLSGEGLYLSYLEGRIGEAPFLVHGRILGFADPTLDLQGEVKHFPAKYFSSSALVLTGGQVDGLFHVTGPLSAPKLKGTIAAKQLQAAGVVLQELKGSGVYQWKTDHLQVDRLQVTTGAGQAVVAGEILKLTKEPFLRLKADAKQVNLAQLPIDLLFEEIPALSGTADLRLRLNGPLSDLSGAAELVVTAGSVSRFTYDSLQVLLSGDRNQLQGRVTLQEKEGTLIATGHIHPETGDYQGDILLRRLELNEQLLPQPFTTLQGKANGLVQVGGNLTGGQRLKGTGWLEVYDLTHNGEELGILKLRGGAENARLTLEDSFLLTPVGQVNLAGIVDWQGKPYYDLTANGADLLLQDLISLWPETLPVGLEGLSGFQLRLTGWEEPLVSGAINGEGIVLNGYYCGNGTADFRWQEGELYLDEFILGQAPMQIRSQGKISAAQVLDVDVEAENFPLAALEQLLKRYWPKQKIFGKISGILTGHGRLGGSFREPTFEGSLSVDQPKIAGFTVDRITGDLSWIKGNLAFDEMLVSRGQEELTVYGKVDWSGAKPYLDLGVKMEEAGLADLLLVTGRAPNFRLDGDVTGYLRLFGALDQPQIRLITQIKNGVINGFTPLNAELDLLIYNSKVTVHRLLLDDGTGELFATGIYTPGAQLDITAQTRNFSIEPLIALTGRSDLAAEGRFDLELALTTTEAGMQGEFDALLHDAAWGEINIASLGLNGQINDDLVFLAAEDLGANRLSIQGQIPLNPAWFGSLQLPTAWPHRYSQIDLGISAEQMEASALNAFLKEPAISGGMIDGLISLNGNWQSPYLVGQVEIANGRGRVAPLPAELRDVNGLLCFSNKGLEFRGSNNKQGSFLEGRMGNGRFRLGGRIISNGLKLEAFDLRLIGDNLHFAPGFFDGLVGGDLTLSGPVVQPMLRGKVTLRKAKIEIPESAGAGLPFDVNLDLRCEAASDVYFRMYGIAYVPFTGRIEVGGSLRKPELNGELTSTRGWVNFLGDTFRIKRLRAEFRPDYKIYPYLDLEATRYLAGTEVTLSTQGWSGDLGSLVINPSSNPAKSREEILKLLNWPEKIDEGGLTFANMFQENINMVGDLFIGRVLDEFRGIMPIDFLTLEQDRQEGTFWMNMGKTLSEDLYLSYSRSLTSLAEQVWTLEWKLVPNFSLLGDYSAAEGLRWQFQYNLHF